MALRKVLAFRSIDKWNDNKLNTLFSSLHLYIKFESYLLAIVAQEIGGT